MQLLHDVLYNLRLHYLLAAVVLAAATTLAVPSSSSPPAAHPLAAFRSLRCPPVGSGGNLPTPVYGTADALFTICTEQLIRAPLSTVYNALLDFPRYARWNSFVVAVKLPAGVQSDRDVFEGMPMTFTTEGLLPLGLNSTSEEFITVLAPRPGDANADGGSGRWALSAWKSGSSPSNGFLRAEHPNVLVDVGGGQTRYVSWETYYLPAAVLLLGLRGNLQKQFDVQGRDLKAYCEGLQV